MRTAAPMIQLRYSRKSGSAWRPASRSSRPAVSPFRPRPLSSAQAAIPIRKAWRWAMTKADALTARIPTGVTTPSVSSTNSRSRRERWLVAAAAGLCAAGVVAGVKRVAARARVNRVRVVDREARAHEAVDVVDLAAADVGGAEVGDHDLHAGFFDCD